MAEVSTAVVSAKDVQRLRQAASVGMMDAKAALIEADGDFDRAFEILRERGLAASAKRADRTASRGGGRVIPPPPGGSGDHRGHGRAGCGDRLRRQERRVHHRSRRDRKARLVGKPDLAPSREDVPEERLDEERRFATVQAENEGKPEQRCPPYRRGEDPTVPPPERPVRPGVRQPEQFSRARSGRW